MTYPRLFILMHLRTHIYNYSDTFKGNDMKIFMDNYITDNTPTCNCSNSPFKDPYHEHVTKGVLIIISHLNLRSLFLLGQKFKPVPSLNISKIHDSLISELMWLKFSFSSIANLTSETKQVDDAKYF